MVLTTSTSLGGQHGDGAPMVVSGVVVALVLEGWQVVGGGPASGSRVFGCFTVACWRFLGVSGGGIGDRLRDGLQVGVVDGGCSGPGGSGGHSVICRNMFSHIRQTRSKSPR